MTAQKNIERRAARVNSAKSFMIFASTNPESFTRRRRAARLARKANRVQSAAYVAKFRK